MIPENNQPLEEEKALQGEPNDEATPLPAPKEPEAEQKENASTLYTSSTFPTTKPRRRSALKRQRKLLVILLAVAILLGAVYIPVSLLTDRHPVQYADGSRVMDQDGTKYYVKKKDGVYAMFAKGGDLCETTSDGLYKTKDQILVTVDQATGKSSVVAVPLMNGTEDIYFNATDGSYDILLYPMIERKDIASIEVKNEKDTFKFVRQKEDTFALEGHPDTPYDSTMFATLISLTGYTNTVARLDLSESNPDAQGFRDNGYAEYGLPENPDDAKQYFIITTTGGITHKVIIGNIILDDTGYYARYAGHDEVYILQQLEEGDYNSTLSGTMLCSLEAYVTPTVTAGVGSTNYFDVTDFTILSAGGGSVSTDLSTFKQIVKFSYEPIEKRKGTFYSNIPYYAQGNLAGYAINDYQADVCLQYIMDLAPLRTVQLYRDHSDTEENLKDFVEKHGVAYAMEFTLNGSRKGEEGDYEPVRDEQVMHQIWVSPLKRNDDGIDVFYMYNEVFDMIVEVARTQMEFLEWDDYKWVNNTIFNGNLGYLAKMEISIGGAGTTAGLTGVNHVLFDVSYVDEKGNPVSGADKTVTSYMKVYATYNGIGEIIADETSDVPKLKDQRFNYFYGSLIASNLEGSMPKGSEDLQESLKATEPDLKITLTYETGEETITRTYCFWSESASSGRGAYMTLNGNGNFYMLQSRVNKIINDIGRVLSKNEADVIDPDAKD
ncbi:MAG: hypothetical protein E7585_04805 [Ruminococcaceae bacterium]|nr:hypothetical protein [Oscillospiraceae bacterium]